MSTVDLSLTTKFALRALIDREARRVGSRTVAFENVARRIGASSSWVRKFLAYDDAVAEPRITLFENIRAAYNNICERIEVDNRADELRWQVLRGRLDEVNSSFCAESRSQNKTGLGDD